MGGEADAALRRLAAARDAGPVLRARRAARPAPAASRGGRGRAEPRRARSRRSASGSRRSSSASAPSCRSATTTTRACARRSSTRCRPTRPARSRELKEYRFVDPRGAAAFDELLEHLREQVMGAHFRQMAEGMQNVTPEDLARFRDMLAELNGLIEQRARGEDTQPGFEDFMARYGDLFPDDPQTLDELLEQMARRMAAMSRLMASLTPGAARGAAGALRADDAGHGPGVRGGPTRAPTSPGAFPEMPWGEPAWGEGDEPMPMSADRRRDGAPARLRGPRPSVRGRLPGRHARRRRRGRAAPHAGRPRGAGPAPAQGDRTGAGEGGPGAAAPRPAGGHATRARASWASAR